MQGVAREHDITAAGSRGDGSSRRRLNRLAEREPMAVGRPQRDLTHAPGFVSWSFQNLSARSNGSAVEAIDVVDAQVRDVAVIAKLTGGGNVRATAEHEGDLPSAAEPPVAWGDVIDFASQDGAVPGT